MSSYFKTTFRTATETSRTCTSSGCVNDSGYPRTDNFNTTMRRLQIASDASNVRVKPLIWKSRNYYTGKAWGNNRSRDLYSSYALYQNGYYLGQVRYYKGRLEFPQEYASSVSVSEPYLEKNEANAVALAKLNSSLKDARTQWNLAVTLGEARETASMIAHSARRLAQGYMSFKKGRVTEAWRQLRGVSKVPVHHQENFRELKRRSKRDTWVDESASAWMEFNYGWKPLLGDIDSAAKYLAEKHVRGYFPVQEVSRAHRVRGAKTTYSGGGYYPRYKLVTRVMSHVRYTYHLRPNWAYKPSTLNELGFTDPYSLAWELLPLSFVTDWFVNVGQVLESLHEFQQWSVVKGIKSYRTSQVLEKEMVKNWGDYTAVETYGTQYQKYSWMDRAILTSLPTSVPLRVKVENPFDLNLGQMASAASLLRFAFR